MAAAYVKNNRNEFEKALGLDMVWLATEMSRPEVGMMTEEECENITTPHLLTEPQKRGAIVNALVRTLELDIDGQNLALFLQILEKKRHQYRKAISMLKGEPQDAATDSVPSKTGQTDASDAVALMKGFGLSDAERNQKVSDIHVIEISGSLCKMWRKLYSFLGLKEIVAYDADRNNFDETEKKMAFFNEWKQQKAYEATYKNLVHALLRVGARDDAISVCEMLALSLGKKIPANITVASTASTVTTPKTTGIKKTVNFSEDLGSDLLYEFLTANEMPRIDAQKIKDLNIGGAAFLHFGEDFWKENGITHVGLFYISHIKKKISVKPDVPASTQISKQPSSPPPLDIQSASDTVFTDSAIPENAGAVPQPEEPLKGFVEIQQVKGEVKGEEVDGNSKKKRRIGKRSLFTAKPEVLWRGYKELKVFFMNSDKKYMLDGFKDDVAGHNKIVLDWMNEWRRSKNSSVPKFKLVQDIKDSDVRVAYSKDSQTSIGMEANDDKDSVSMELNLKYVHKSLKDKPDTYAHNYKKYTVLHETGHTLGFYHEHQHPIFSGNVFERENVLEDLQKEYKFSHAKAIKCYDANFGPEPDPGFEYPFDCHSIMRYQNDATTEINGYCFPQSALSGTLTDSDISNASEAYKCTPKKRGALKTFEEELSLEDIYYLLFKYLSPCVPMWREIAENLGIKRDKVKSIATDIRFRINAPGSYLVAVLQHWQNRFTRDATLDKLTEAIKNVWPDVPDLSINYDSTEFQDVTWDDLWGILNKE